MSHCFLLPSFIRMWINTKKKILKRKDLSDIYLICSIATKPFLVFSQQSWTIFHPILFLMLLWSIGEAARHCMQTRISPFFCLTHYASHFVTFPVSKVTRPLDFSAQITISWKHCHHSGHWWTNCWWCLSA